MAIRGPHHPHPADGPARSSPSTTHARSPLDRLVEFGAARTPAEARRVVETLLTALRAAGFPVPAAGDANAKLSSSLREFQHAHALPTSGTLDRGTLDALVHGGLLPGPASSRRDASSTSSGPSTTLTAPTAPTDAPARFDAGPTAAAPSMLLSTTPKTLRNTPVPADARSTRHVETSQARDRVAQDRPPIELDLRSLLTSLRSAGFVGVGRGNEQLKDALTKLQRVEELPRTGQLDGHTADALLRRGMIDDAAAQSLRAQDPRYAPPEHAAPSSSSDARTSNARAEQRAEGKGVMDGALQDTRGQGHDETSGASSGRGTVGGDGTGGTARDVDGRVDEGDPDGRSDDSGNAVAGDEDDDDAKRGRANRDDAIDAAAGHWQVPPLSLQVIAAVDAIARDVDDTGAATYSWDVTLHRPGIYAPGQPAEELLHVVVTRAGPFDPSWRRACDAMNAHLHRLEPDAHPLHDDDMAQALRRARYRA